MNQFVEFRPDRQKQMRAYLAGTRIRVNDLAMDYERHGMTAEEIAREYPQLSLAQVYAGIAFFHQNRQELRAQIRQDETFVEALRKKPVFILNNE